MNPNIIVILADDLGYSDIGCYGGEIPTPHLDRLADSGVRMSQFYSTPRCSPSRASLLTGRYAHDVGIGILTADDRPHGYPGSLSPAAPTIAEIMSNAGYRTGLSGKWHLSADVSRPNESWPMRRGFGHFYGILTGCSSYFQPRAFYRNETPIDDEARDRTFYFTDAITEDAVSFVAGSEDPFFLFVAYTAPHWPLHAKDEDLARHRGRFREGWDVLRQRRLERLVDEGLLPQGTRMSPRDEAERPWTEVSDQEWQQRRMEAYAAQVTAMDNGIGQLLDQLDASGKRQDTLIVFLSDNGACAEEIPPVGPGEFLNETLCPSRTTDGRPVRIGNSATIEPGPEDTYASYGRAWANLSNAPLRRYKRWVHEGGIASPLIASWPNGGVVPGSVVHEPAHMVDLLPTLCHSVACDVPDRVEGSTLLNLWRGEPEPKDRSLCWEHLGNAAIRRGPWKLVRAEGEPWELYNMVQDRTELDDRSGEHGQLVAELAQTWEDWAAHVGVIPWADVKRWYRTRGLSERAAEG